MADKITKLNPNIYEIRKTVTNEEVTTVNIDVLNEDIRTAIEALGRREGELASAQARVDELTALKTQLTKIK
jgi:hypothetical protein